VVEPADPAGGLEGRGVHAGDADERAPQGGGVGLGGDAAHGLLAVVLVAVHAGVDAQHRAGLGAVDDDQRDAEVDTVGARADGDQALGALAGGAAQ
jgi:hypothetical protein